MSNYIAVAKFYVAEVLKSGYPDFQSSKPVVASIKVTLRPVSFKEHDPSHENSRFWTASPSGEMTIYIQNANLFDKFQVGEEIYLPMILADGVALSELSNALHAVADNPLPSTETEA